MILTSKNLKRNLNLYWPGIYTLTTDRFFRMPTKQKFVELAMKAKALIVDEVEAGYIQRLYECEDITKVLMGRIIELRVADLTERQLPIDYVYSWPFGICFGTEFNGWVGNHWGLIAYLDDNIYLMDSQTMEIWAATPVTDKILFALI